ncbi:MAG: hypothetical protein P4L33_07380 [Capsulimonadaceae bacterium]|nr:hypothetical protein [Capsulimonadaceae bacterium]
MSRLEISSHHAELFHALSVNRIFAVAGWPMDKFTILLLIVSAAVLLSKLFTDYERKRRYSGVSGRPLLSEDEIYNQYFQDQIITRQAFVAVWRKIAKLLHTKPGYLRPTDKLDDLAGHPKITGGDSAGVDRLRIAVESRLLGATHLDAKFIATLRDVAIILAD